MKDKKSIVEVFPAKRMAKIKGHSLCLSGPDGPDSLIELLNCTVLAVSASSTPSRKWSVLYTSRKAYGLPLIKKLSFIIFYV